MYGDESLQRPRKDHSPELDWLALPLHEAGSEDRSDLNFERQLEGWTLDGNGPVDARIRIYQVTVHLDCKAYIPQNPRKILVYVCQIVFEDGRQKRAGVGAGRQPVRGGQRWRGR